MDDTTFYKALNESIVGQKLYSKSGVPGEIDYFRRMLEYFKADKRCCVLEVHQKQVGANNIQNTCEIADLMVIAYSQRYDCLKVTFLQAKYEPKPQDLSHPLHFQMDKRQYHLLKTCPGIIPVTINLHPRILADSCSPSITSYGVFYKDNMGNVDFGFEVTQLLKPSQYGKISGQPGGGRCYFDTNDEMFGFTRWCDGLHCHICHVCHKYCRLPWHFEREDLLSSVNANTFEDALFNFRIGSPICCRYGLHKEIARSIFDTVNDSAREDGTNINNFNAFFRRYAETHDISLEENGTSKDRDTREPKEPEGMPFSVGAILLVDVDGEEPIRRED